MHLRHDAEAPDVARLIIADALVVARSECGNNFGRHELGGANRGAHAEQKVSLRAYRTTISTHHKSPR